MSRLNNRKDKFLKIEKNTGMYDKNVINNLFIFLFANFDDVNQTVIINQQTFYFYYLYFLL